MIKDRMHAKTKEDREMMYKETRWVITCNSCSQKVTTDDGLKSDVKKMLSGGGWLFEANDAAYCPKCASKRLKEKEKARKK